jgi:hypothetical protein
MSGIAPGYNSAWAYEKRTPYNQQWNFNVQRNLTSNVIRCRDILASNEGITKSSRAMAARPDQMTPANNLLALVPNPFFGFMDHGAGRRGSPVRQPPPARTVRRLHQRRTRQPAWGNCNYHSFQTRFEIASARRSRHGHRLHLVQVQLADSSDGIWNGQGTLRNWYCRCGAPSPATFDVHRLVVDYNYEIPFGKGHSSAPTSLARQRLPGGWQTNGVFTVRLRYAAHLRPTTNNSFSSAASTARWRRRRRRVAVRSIDRWFDTTQFKVADYHLRQPRPDPLQPPQRLHRGLNYSMMKNTGSGNSSMSSSAPKPQEFFTNAPLFGKPNTNVESGAFGTITGQSNGPRTIQLGLKLLF